MSTPADIPFEKLLEALLDPGTPFNPRYLHRLSDLEGSELTSLQAVWPQVPLWRRQALLEDIEDLSAEDMLLSFVSLGSFAVQDSDPKVRLLAVRTLWEYEEKSLAALFLDLLKEDPDADVRAAAAGALGRFVYAGELEEIPSEALCRIEDALIGLVDSAEAPQIRRSALESLGFSSRDEVPPFIESAFASKEKEWVASALFAMGRSANRRWEPQVMQMLESNLPLLRSEAARAAGELEIQEAVPYLVDLLDDPDETTRLASIWSLSQIGGEGIRQIFERLYEEAEDDQEIELLESALDNLAFNEGMQFMPLFDFPEDDDLDEFGGDNGNEDSYELDEDDEEDAGDWATS